ncbi:hypothetical protein FA011_RS03595 [Escherichia coli]|nr:hypothetical protein [Escherichia coli]
MTVRILAVCGNGQGSSMIMKMKVDQFLTQSNIDHTVNSCAVGVRNMLSPADFGPKLLEVIKAHFPQDVK